jgi:3-hydroxybutyryl-CoA dehydrogenase
VQTEPPESFPEGVVVWPAGPTTQGVAARIGKASIQFATENAPHPDGLLLTVGDAAVYLTDGRSATQRAHDDHQPNTVLVDLALDYTKATRIALTRGDQCSAMAYQSAVGLFQAAGYAISRLDDVPGMAVMRTVAMLANEAADAVNQGVCDALAADVAMQKGVNYPEGPLAWADAIGLRYVMTVLDNLAHAYGEDRYRVSYLIRRKVWSGARFHE